MPPKSRSVVGSIVAAGLVAGVIDIGAACAVNAMSLTTILHVVASGLVGKRAFQQDMSTAWLGLALQCAMSIVIAAIFVVAGRQLSVPRRLWVGWGLIYGAIVFAVMNYVVMLLSAIGRPPHFTIVSFIENFLAMLLFGLIVSFVTRPAAVAPDSK